MELIRDTIQAVVKSWDEDRKKGFCDPAALLKKILTKQELRHAKAGSVRQGILSINVDSSSWLYHLGLQKEGLLTKLRAQTGAIKDIRFYLGEVNAKEKNKTH